MLIHKLKKNQEFLFIRKRGFHYNPFYLPYPYYHDLLFYFLFVSALIISLVV
jgi:hypothetical protein